MTWGPRHGPHTPNARKRPGKAVALLVNGGFMAIEERVIASWKYKKGVLDPKTAYLCYLAANLAAGNTH